MGSFAKTEAVVVAYLNDLNAQLDAGRRKIDGFDRILEDVLRQQPSQPNAQENRGNTTLELGDGTIQQILGLAERASFNLYAQQIFEERQRVVDEVSELEKQIAMTTFEVPTEVYSPQDPSVAAEKLRELTDEYKDILNKVLDRARSVSGQLFVEISTPAADIKRITAQSIAMLIVPVVIGAVLAIIYLLISGMLGMRNGRT
jgi:hypothetical protein